MKHIYICIATNLRVNELSKIGKLWMVHNSWIPGRSKERLW